MGLKTYKESCLSNWVEIKLRFQQHPSKMCLPLEVAPDPDARNMYQMSIKYG